MAAYALNLQPGMFGSIDTNYTDSLELAGMSAKQAEAFADTYMVVDQDDTDSSGFSVTVFAKGGINGTKYFAIRGTENLLCLSSVIDYRLWK